MQVSPTHYSHPNPISLLLAIINSKAKRNREIRNKEMNEKQVYC